jgi:hypothetical protein
LRFTGLSLRQRDGQLEVMATSVTFAARALVPFAGTLECIVPRSSLPVLASLKEGEVAMIADERNARFRCGSRELTCRQLIGPFTEWSAFTQDLAHSATITPELAKTIERVGVTQDRENWEGWSPLKLTFDAESLLVESRSPNSGQSEERVAMPSTLNGHTVTLGLNSNLLLKALGQGGRLSFQDKAPLVRLLPESAINLEYAIGTCRLQW